MKILTIGSERNLFNVDSAAAQRILEYGKLVDELHIIVFTPHHPEVRINLLQGGEGFTKKGYQSVNLSDKVHVYPTNSLTKLNYFFDAVKIGKEICSKERIDVISTQDPFESALVGNKIKKRCQAGLNIQIHGDFFSDDYYRKKSFINRFRFRMANKILPQADSIRVVSQRIADSLRKFNISQDKIIKVPIHVDYKKLTEAQINYDLHQEFPGKFVILSVGRLVKEKNIGLLIEAFQKVIKKHPESVLVIAGNGVEEENLKLKTKNLGLSDKVIFKGWQEDLAGYYKSADLFVVSSGHEGYNRTVIEAMACGCPVVMTNVGLAGEIIKDGVNGLVVKTNDTDGLAGSISRLIQDSNLRNSFSEKGLATVQSLPSKEETLTLYLKSWEMAMK